MVTENTSFPGKGSLKAFNGSEERSFPPKGTLKAHNGYRGKEFSRQRDTKGLQWLPKKGVFH
ncbi:hypothetical protein BWZ43_07090 [Heyndrickxia oleronia]|uniref:Uncharacterized protein n=1 Tax=Heyndrickxia oleronia TaxID=38875 RepID=A0A8E2LF72_9BACI|nr:hypothetical protein BWZ43_07090 [Heyndrickxia oleronia]